MLLAKPSSRWSHAPGGDTMPANIRQGIALPREHWVSGFLASRTAMMPGRSVGCAGCQHLSRRLPFLLDGCSGTELPVGVCPHRRGMDARAACWICRRVPQLVRGNSSRRDHEPGEVGNMGQIGSGWLPGAEDSQHVERTRRSGIDNRGVRDLPVGGTAGVRAPDVCRGDVLAGSVQVPVHHLVQRNDDLGSARVKTRRSGNCRLSPAQPDGLRGTANRAGNRHILPVGRTDRHRPAGRNRRRYRRRSRRRRRGCGDGG